MDHGSLRLMEGPVWRRERQRFLILQWVYEQSGAGGDAVVSGPQVAVALDLQYEDLYHAIDFLTERRYLTYVGAGPRVRITPKGTRYLEEDARRRRTVRA